MYLENTSGNHNKFYRVDICYDNPSDEYIVESEWGRINGGSQWMVKTHGEDFNTVIDNMEKLLLQKLFKRGYNMMDVQRWPYEAREGDEELFVEEDWD